MTTVTIKLQSAWIATVILKSHEVRFRGYRCSKNEPPSFKYRLIIYKNHNKGTSCIENNQAFYKQWFENHKILIKTNKHARLEITYAHWTKRALQSVVSSQS